MFGYATDETEECMPLTIVLAHKLNTKLAELRHSGDLPWLRPDSKTQVNIAFTQHVPLLNTGVMERILSSPDHLQAINNYLSGSVKPLFYPKNLGFLFPIFNYCYLFSSECRFKWIIQNFHIITYSLLPTDCI